MSLNSEGSRAAAGADEIADLVAAARRGDRAAFGQLYHRFAPMVHAIALGRLPVDRADDLVQDVFLRALRRLRSLRDVHAFGAWIGRIARNAATDAAHDDDRQRGDADAEPSAPETQHDELEARAALACIRSLPAAYRDTLMMRLVQGLSGPEIAERTGLTPASVRVNLHRGMKMLRKRLEESVRSQRC